MLIDWRAALVFVTREPDWKPRIGLGGLLMLVVPPIGWVLALGSWCGRRPPWLPSTA